jgi:hypothetical protein
MGIIYWGTLTRVDGNRVLEKALKILYLGAVARKLAAPRLEVF